MISRLTLACLTGLLALGAGCSPSPDSALPTSAPGGHIHVALHGGVLVEVGDHAYNLELVRDSDAGKLTVYVLDGHAENFVRIAVPSFELIAITGRTGGHIGPNLGRNGGRHFAVRGAGRLAEAGFRVPRRNKWPEYTWHRVR